MKWIPTWSSVPVSYNAYVGEIEDVSIRTVIRNNLKASKLRVIFSNVNNAEPVEIERVHIAALRRSDRQITDFREVRLYGQSSIHIPAYARLQSDDIPLNITPDEDIQIIEYFKKKTGICTMCMTWSKKIWETSFGKGDQTGFAKFIETPQEEYFTFIGEDSYSKNVLVGIDAVLAYANNNVKVFAAFGDSLTAMGYYTGELADSLYTSFPGEWTVINCGMNGNRLLKDAPFVPGIPGNGKVYGRSGMKRFRADLFRDGIPDVIFLLEGANDCMLSYRYGEEGVPSGGDVARAVRDCKEIADATGALLIAGTIPPLACIAQEWAKDAESLREEINNSLVKAIPASRLVDTDKVLRDPDEPRRSKPSLTLSDGVHLNEEGGKLLAAEIRRVLAGL